MQRLLVTGGAGFIGSNFVHHVLARGGYQVVNLDLLTYAGNLANLSDVAADPHYRFVQGDIADAAVVAGVFDSGIDAVVNFAAESHVDRSIADPAIFVRTNVLGTEVLLDAAHRHGVRRYVQISTDEVYGSLGPTGFFSEASPLDPSSPYSASKTGADLLVLAYGRTFGLPVNVTRCSNNYGPYQFPEKLIPHMIARALCDQPLPVYGDGLNVRDWLHVADHCEAIRLVLEGGRPGEVYNVGGRSELPNIGLVRQILALLGKPEALVQFVTDRPGHDRRYAIDPSKIEHELGWQPRHRLETGLEATVSWYVSHQDWWRPLVDRK